MTSSLVAAILVAAAFNAALAENYFICDQSQLTATHAFKHLKSTHYPNDYSHNQNCGVRITAPQGMKVELKIREFHLEENYDFAYVYDGANDGATLMKTLHGNKGTGAGSVTSTGNEMYVKYTSDYSVSKSGFWMKFRVAMHGSCQGFNLLPNWADKMVADTRICDPVEVMKSVQNAALCAASSPQAFGEGQALWAKNFDVSMLCNIIGQVMSLGVLFPADACHDINELIITPIMNRTVIDHHDIIELVKRQLEDIGNRVLNLVSAGVDLFSGFLDSVEFCPRASTMLDVASAVPFTPMWWVDKIDDIVDLIETISKLSNKAPDLLNQYKNNLMTDDCNCYECKTYSVIVTVDLNALMIAGMEKGMYITWHMDHGVTEVGIVNGVSSTYDLAPSWDVSIGGTLAMVMGDKSVWGEWGYTLELGASVPVYGVGVGGSIGLIFTADAETKALGNFIGMSMSVSLALGQSSGTVEFDASVSCGYLAASAFNEKADSTCLASKVDSGFDNVLSSLRGVEDVWDRKLDEMQRCGQMYACQADKCAYGFEGSQFSHCESAAGSCSSNMAECMEWKYECQKVETDWECSAHECRDAGSQVCNWLPNDCGWFDWFCSAFTQSCNWVSNIVCDGACLTWEAVGEHVVEFVATGATCAAQGAVEIVEKTTCLEYLPQCAEAGGCYVAEGVTNAAECVGGFIVPSEQCLSENGFSID